MEPGQREINLYKGSKYDEIFEFLVPGGTTPVNVAALTFTAEVRHVNSNALLLTFTTSHNDAEGSPLATNKIRVTASASDTDNLIVGDSVKWGIRDQYKNYFGHGKANILLMVPE